MNGPIRHLAAVIFAAFAVLVGAVTFLQVIQGPEYRDDPRNIRVVTGRAGKERGTIITADGVPVARSSADPDDPQLFTRTYPEGAGYAHVVGYATLIFGATGIEASQSEALVSDRDATISGVLNAIVGGDIRPKGLRLTIVDDLQQAAIEALGTQTGAVVALDPDTGAVLAMVSSPSFDPATLQGRDAGPAGNTLEADPTEPLRNRAIDQTYPPGSTFKIVTAAAALEAGIAGGGTTFPDPVELDLPGSTATIRNYDEQVCGNGDTVTLTQALVSSCNTVFGDLGMQVGAERLVSMAEAFGFNREIPFDLTALVSAIPDADSFADDVAGVAQSAIGQRDVRATPLQMALVGAAIANEGEIMEPYLVQQIFDSEASIESETVPAVWRRAVSPATAAALTDLMEKAVSSGTGFRAQISGVSIAGKTGTAEVPDEAPDVWFVGFGPVSDDPEAARIVVAVVVEDGGPRGTDGTGGSVAAPIAKAVMEAFLGQ
ncbi:MAG: penicillin-binding protein 2 [bacterium]|nr:penicillin-binding protein 2 [bacterium]